VHRARAGGRATSGDIAACETRLRSGSERHWRTRRRSPPAHRDRRDRPGRPRAPL